MIYPKRNVCHIRNSQYLGLLRAVLTSPALRWNSYLVPPFTTTQASAREKRATAKDLWEKNSICLHFQLILEMTFTVIRKPKTWDKLM